MRTRRLALSSALFCLVITGCSTDPAPSKRDRSAAGSAPRTSAPASPAPRFSVAPGASIPTEVPAARGLVTTRDPVAVTRNAEGRINLCTGVITLMPGSLCTGPELIGFGAKNGESDPTGSSLTRVVGRFDGKRLYVTDVMPAGPSRREVDDDLAARLRTPCPEPAGGWRIIDAANATGTAAGRAMKVARQQRGFAEFRYDRSFDSVPSVLNVAVVGDRAAAEAALREVWGGALCVSGATHPQRALKWIATEVFRLPGVHTAAVRRDEVHLEVLYDDGTLQAWVDATYGPGLVTISSALVPASG